MENEKVKDSAAEESAAKMAKMERVAGKVKTLLEGGVISDALTKKLEIDLKDGKITQVDGEVKTIENSNDTIKTLFERGIVNSKVTDQLGTSLKEGATAQVGEDIKSIEAAAGKINILYRGQLIDKAKRENLKKILFEGQQPFPVFLNNLNKIQADYEKEESNRSEERMRVVLGTSEEKYHGGDHRGSREPL